MRELKIIFMISKLSDWTENVNGQRGTEAGAGAAVKSFACTKP